MANEGQEALKGKLSKTSLHVDKFIARLELFLGKNLDKIFGELQKADVTAAEAANILGSLFGELEKAGLSKEIGQLREMYADELRFVRDEFAKMGYTKPLSDADRPLVDALIDNGLNKISNKVDLYGLDIQAQTMQRVLTGEVIDYETLSEEIGPKLSANIKTELETAAMTFSRTVTANKAEELGITLFEYIGPDDKITRDFCRDLLRDRTSHVYTKEEISSMDNGQGLPVQTSGGGYNCRHHWQPVSEKRAKELGYAGGE